MGNFIDKHLFCQTYHVNENPRVKKMRNTNIDYIYYKVEYSKDILIYSHGNQENLDSTDHFLSNLSQKLNMSIFTYDYLPEPNVKNVNKSIDLVYDYVTNHLDYDTSNIILAGYSIGTGPTMFCAHLTGLGSYLKCVVLISPFSSIRKEVSSYMGCIGNITARCIEERYDNLKYTVHVQCPILLIHGKDDKVILCENSEEIYSVYRNINKNTSIELLAGYGHNNICNSSLIGDIIIKFKNKLN